LPVIYLEAAKPRHSFPVGTAGQSLLPHLPGLPSPNPEFPDAAALLITKFPGFLFGHPGWHVEHGIRTSPNQTTATCAASRCLHPTWRCSTQSQFSGASRGGFSQAFEPQPATPAKIKIHRGINLSGSSHPAILAFSWEFFSVR
jgi:hypothetical protein